MKKQQGFSMVEFIIVVAIIGIIGILAAVFVAAVAEPYTKKCLAGFTYLQDNLHGGITQVFGQNGPVPCQ